MSKYSYRPLTYYSDFSKAVKNSDIPALEQIHESPKGIIQTWEKDTCSISDAINAGNLPIVKWLVEHCYWTPTKTSICIDQAAESGDIEMIKYLDTHAKLIFTQRALETNNLQVLNFFKEKIENKITLQQSKANDSRKPKLEKFSTNIN